MGIQNVHFSIFVIQAIIVTIGTISNLISFMVWLKGKVCHTLPIALYFRLLAAMDTFILLVPGVELLLYVSPYNIILRDLSSVTCTLYPGLTSSSVRVSSWIISSFTIERTLYIYFPTRFRVVQNSKRTLTITACLIIVSLLMDLPIFIRSELKPPDIKLNSTLNVTSQNFTSEINGAAKTLHCSSSVKSEEIILDGITKFMLPLIILVGCNSLILVQFRRQSRFSMRTGSQKVQGKRQVRYRNAIYQIIAISVFHCISTGPWSILASCGEFGCVDGRFYHELLLAFNSLAYLNSAVNVLLYCFIGNDFRADLKRLFYSRTKNKPATVQIDTISSRVVT